jgi:hypothetical protein
MAETSEIVAVARSYTERFRAGHKQTAQGMVVMATVAHEVHEQYGYASYMKWLIDNFGVSETFAKNLLRVHELTLRANFALDDLSQFAPSAINLLAAPSTPREVVDRAMDTAKAGKPVTHKAVREAMRDAKPKANGKPEKVVATRAASKPEPEPPVTDATDLQPWKAYNALLDEGIELVDRLDALFDRIRTTPFGGWRFEKDDRTFCKNLRTRFQQYRVTNWAPQNYKPPTHPNDNFLYAKDEPRRGRA